ncbi:MAG: hypothetical protein E7262_08890 [Lachnospiraceae bacterium]|nr:hypothetical protein [Lachnospiraceae bacterium]
MKYILDEIISFFDLCLFYTLELLPPSLILTAIIIPLQLIIANNAKKSGKKIIPTILIILSAGFYLLMVPGTASESNILFAFFLVTPMVLILFGIPLIACLVINKVKSANKISTEDNNDN